jgi:ferredoxin
MEMEGPHFEEFYPNRQVDASHPDLMLDLNRCILCGLCVRASHDVDGKDVFAIGGHGIQTHLLVNSPSGKLSTVPLPPPTVLRTFARWGLFCTNARALPHRLVSAALMTTGVKQVGEEA